MLIYTGRSVDQIDLIWRVSRSVSGIVERSLLCTVYDPLSIIVVIRTSGIRILRIKVIFLAGVSLSTVYVQGRGHKGSYVFCNTRICDIQITLIIRYGSPYMIF